MKTILAATLGLLLGVVIGAGALHQWLMPQLLDANSALAETRRTLANLETESGDALARLARLEAERGEYSERLDAAYARLGSAPQITATVPAVEEEADFEADPLDAAPADPAEEAANGDRRDPDGNRDEGRDRGRDGGSRWGGTDEERAARRQEFAARMQENMTNFFTGELEKSSTPEMQNRLVLLEEKAYEMMELGSQLRRAETDEERDALRQAFGDTMSAAQGIMQEQQRDMLGAIASEFGISSAGDQAAFEQAVRAAISSPMFSDNPGSLVWGAGRERGFGGGGFGGGPDRRP